ENPAQHEVGNSRQAKNVADGLGDPPGPHDERCQQDQCNRKDEALITTYRFLKPSDGLSACEARRLLRVWRTCPSVHRAFESDTVHRVPHGSKGECHAGKQGTDLDHKLSYSTLDLESVEQHEKPGNDSAKENKETKMDSGPRRALGILCKLGRMV